MKNILFSLIIVLILTLTLSACSVSDNAHTTAEGNNISTATPQKDEALSAVGSYRYVASRHGDYNSYCVLTLHEDGRYWVICNRSLDELHTGTWERTNDSIVLTSTCDSSCRHSYEHKELPGHIKGTYDDYSNSTVEITVTKSGLIVKLTKDHENGTIVDAWFLERI